MTTPRDLLTVALDMDSNRPVEQGDMSLALAGAELIDLLEMRAITVDGERIVPVDRPTTGDRLLDEAASSLVLQEPFETVSDWLWRRGRGLFSAYLADREVDSPAHRAAAERWSSGDAVLVALAACAGIHGERTADSPGITDDAVATVLATVNAAVMELALERQRRAIEEAGFDNIWRGG